MTIAAFSWGYYGWGTETEAFVRLTEEVERARGFAAPVFVDVRVRRQGRAKGFVGDAFQQLVPERSVWMPQLGNRRIVEGGDGVQIVEPAAAKDLLLLMVRAHAEGRRAIFFCGCASPERRHLCHRAEVGRLVQQEARKKKVALVIDEWPGTAPVTFELPVAAAAIRRVRASTAEADAAAPLVTLGDVDAAAMQMGHGSIGKLHAGDDAVVVVTGPVVRRARGWCLPIHAHFDGIEAARARAWSTAFRRRLGLPPLALA